MDLANLNGCDDRRNGWTATFHHVQETGPTSARGYRSLLSSTEYLGLLISRLVSLIGDQLSRVALTVLVYERTQSPFLSAAAYAASYLPVVVGGPLLGGLADRLPKRRLLVVADLSRAVLVGLMAVPGMPLWALFGLMTAAAAIEGPAAAARAPLMREVLVDDDGYQLGSGLDEALDQSGQILGFVAAGALLVVLEPEAALALDAVSFLVSAAIVRLLLQHREAAAAAPASDAPAPRRGAGARQAIADARLGWRAAMQPACRRPLLLTWVTVSCMIAPEALATPYASALGAGTRGIGLLFAAGAVGNVLGLLLVGRVGVALGQRLLLPLCVLSLLPLVFCVFDPDFPVVLALVTVSGLGGSFSLLARVAFVRGLPPDQRGRAFSVAASGVTALQGVAIAASGALAAALGPATAVAVSGAVGLVLLVVVERSSTVHEAAEDLADTTAGS